MSPTIPRRLTAVVRGATLADLSLRGRLVLDVQGGHPDPALPVLHVTADRPPPGVSRGA